MSKPALLPDQGETAHGCEWCGKTVDRGRRFCGRSHAKKWHWANRRETILEPLTAANQRRRKYEPEQRSCLYCGNSLGLVRGSRIQGGRGKFCNPSHKMRWQWENRPERLRRRRRGHLIVCPGCGAERYRQASYMRRREKGRLVLCTEYCRKCRGELREVLAHLAYLRDGNRQALRQLKAEEGLYDRHEAAGRLGKSPGHITRYVVAGVLTPVVRELGGISYMLFHREEVERLARRLRRTRRRLKRIRDLRPRRPGPKPRQGPSPIELERDAMIRRAADELRGQAPSRRRVRLRAAELAAAERPYLLPGDYVQDGRLRPHYDEPAIDIFKRAEKACKS